MSIFTLLGLTLNYFVFLRRKVNFYYHRITLRRFFYLYARRAFFSRDRINERCSWGLRLHTICTIVYLTWALVSWIVAWRRETGILEHSSWNRSMGHPHVPHSWRSREILPVQSHRLVPSHHHMGLLCLHLHLSVLVAPILVVSSLPLAFTREVWRTWIIVLNFIVAPRSTARIHIIAHRLNLICGLMHLISPLMSNHLSQLLIVSHSLPHFQFMLSLSLLNSLLPLEEVSVTSTRSSNVVRELHNYLDAWVLVSSLEHIFTCRRRKYLCFELSTPFIGLGTSGSIFLVKNGELFLFFTFLALLFLAFNHSHDSFIFAVFSRHACRSIFA